MAVETPNLTETHYPRIIFDGIQYRAVCTCGWLGAWTGEKKDAEFQWGAHGVKTIKKNVSQPKRFVIVGNPLAKKEEP